MSCCRLLLKLLQLNVFPNIRALSLPAWVIAHTELKLTVTLRGGSLQPIYVHIPGP